MLNFKTHRALGTARNTSTQDLALEVSKAFAAAGQVLTTTADMLATVNTSFATVGATAEQEAAFRDFAVSAIASFRRVAADAARMNSQLSGALQHQDLSAG